MSFRHHAIAAALAATTFLAAAGCSSPEQRLERYYESGQEFLEAGDMGKANVQFRNALKIDETHVPSLVGLAEIAEQEQDFQGMFALLQNIVRHQPDNVDAIVKLGKIYLIGSDETTALENAERALVLDANNLDAQALKSAVYLKIGDTARAVEVAQKVVAADPRNSEAVTVLATERMLAEDSDAAIAIIDASLEAEEKVAVLQLLRLRILSKLGRDDEVLEAHRDLIRLFPDELGYRRIYANELVSQEKLPQALAAVEEIIALDASNIDAKFDAVRIARTLEGADAAEARLRSYAEAEPDNSDLQFALADYYKQTNSFDLARGVYDGLQSSGDSDVRRRADNEIAALLLRDGDRDGAQKMVSDILQADETNSQALTMRAGLFVDGGDYDAAIRDLRTVLDNSPNSTTALLLMAAAFEKKGENELAEANLVRANDANANNPRMAQTLARFLLRQRKLDRAEEVLVNSLSNAPGNQETLKLLGAIRLSNQNWTGAQQVASILESVEDDAAADDIRAVAFSGLKDYDGLIDTLTERSERSPLESRPLATLIGAYIETDRGDEAIETLQSVIASKEDDYFERILLAQVLQRENQVEQAEAELLNATRQHPDRAEAFELLYRFYVRQGERGKARQLIADGLAAAPGNEALRIFEADILLTEGRRQDAYAIYSELVESRPNDKIVVNNFVSLTSDLRSDPASIQRALDAAGALAGDENPYFMDTLGWAHYRAGNFDQALPLIQGAAAAAEDNADIVYHLGAAYLATGDKDNARIELERALQLGGDNFQYRDAVSALLGQL